MSSRTRRLKLLGAVLTAAAVVVAGAIALSQSHDAKSAAKPQTATEATRLFAGIPQHGTTLGDPKAPVTLTEFADLQCPFCGAFSNTKLPAVVADYVRTGKVRLVFRNLSFIGPDSQKAARFAAAAGLQHKLYDFVDRFYANQETENTGYVTDGFLRKVAAQVGGLDVDKAFQDQSSPAVAAQLAAAKPQATKGGVDSTPTFVLDGGTYHSSNVLAALKSA